VCADKTHDNRRIFNLLDNLNIEPAIQIRKNASIRRRWKQLKDTGRRWIAEIVFSSLKRLLGEGF
jgi:hypothetical protein